MEKMDGLKARSPVFQPQFTHWLTGGAHCWLTAIGSPAASPGPLPIGCSSLATGDSHDTKGAGSKGGWQAVHCTARRPRHCMLILCALQFYMLNVLVDVGQSDLTVVPRRYRDFEQLHQQVPRDCRSIGLTSSCRLS